VKGFGCRPEHERSMRYKAGVRNPPGRNPRAAGWTVAVYGDLTGRRLGLEMRSRASSAGATIAVASLPLPPRLVGRFWPGRR
jgi:hypothetical protein